MAGGGGKTGINLTRHIADAGNNVYFEPVSASSLRQELPGLLDVVFPSPPGHLVKAMLVALPSPQHQGLPFAAQNGIHNGLAVYGYGHGQAYLACPIPLFRTRVRVAGHPGQIRVVTLPLVLGAHPNVPVARPSQVLSRTALHLHELDALYRLHYRKGIQVHNH